MKHYRLIGFAVCFVLAFGCCSFALAQDRTKAYYNTHESEILPDARRAFSDGRYERTIDLCEWYYIIVGESTADELKDKATRCAKLSPEMESFVAAGQYDAAREKAKGILALNPDDKRAKEVSTYDPTRGKENGYNWVDLGLSVKWATCNVGASSPSDYGSYYAWGETTPKNVYSWAQYKYRVSGDDWINISFSKYNTVDKLGSVDNKTQLDLSDDAAHTNWGGLWRMPTEAEFNELKSNCTYTWATLNGKRGFMVTSKKNGNSIFFPAAGYQDAGNLEDAGSGGCYWSSSLDPDDPYSTRCLDFSSSGFHVGGSNRCLGFPIRPVME